MRPARFPTLAFSTALLVACGDDGSGDGETGTDETTGATADDDTVTVTNPASTDAETSGNSLDGSESGTTKGTGEDSGTGTTSKGDETGTGTTGDATGTGEETGPMGCAAAQNEGMCNQMEGCLWVGAMNEGVCTPIDEVECADVTDAKACAILPDCVWNPEAETCDPE